MGKNKYYFSNKVKSDEADVKDIEHQITYPGQQEFNLRNVSFAPGENKYLRGYSKDSDE